MTNPQESTSSRRIAHAAVRSALIQAAKTELASVGSAALSLRAVARSVGMAPSGVYRYFASRDDLLTALILDAYHALGDAVDAAELSHSHDAPLDRWRALCGAIRTWALENPHEYALIYGSPVPGYHAPDATTSAALRTLLPLLRLIDLVSQPVPPARPFELPPVSDALHAQFQRLDGALPGLTVERMDTALAAWALLFGQINFEVFGRLGEPFENLTELFLHNVDVAAWLVGITNVDGGSS